MKICVISFDFWNYDSHIVDELRNQGIDAHHINIGAYQHKNFFAKIKNAFSKVVFRRNLKTEKRQKMILDRLNKLGKQDQILVINPELIQREFHLEIKKSTNRYKAYLYDSLSRCPAEHLLDLFDEVFSFDKADAEKHGFQLITNYNYLPENQMDQTPKFDLVYLASFDKRLVDLYEIIKKLEKSGLSVYAKIVGKKSWKKRLFTSKNSSVSYGVKRIRHEEIPDYYKKGKVLLDLIRDKQTGLSFRIFEAMALKKKIITNNHTIKDYDFYNDNNILVLNEDFSNLQKSFFETDYQELNPEIYRKYTLENWVKIVFDL
jgi:glycosyltransferase involved in cell wall biosynthesis